MLPTPAWEVAPCKSAEARQKLASTLSISDIAATCLVNRGILDEKSAEQYLHPKLRELKPPDHMADLAKGAARVADAVVARDRIGVFGDYDVDGLTSTSLMYLFLRETASAVEVRTADRFSGGYGLDCATVDHYHNCKCSVLVVLDCGTSDHEAIGYAQSLGIDVVVVDHHRIEAEYPPAHAFINPHRKDCRFDDTTLAAVGLTFYFCAAIKSQLVHKGYIDNNQIDMRSFLDLVALGTIADVVPLGQNNRILASHGLKMMSDYRRPGIEALINIARIHSKSIHSSHVSYQLAPRINAAGRLANAMDAFELLVSTVESDARQYAELLEHYTHERREIEARVSKEARAQALSQVDNDPKVILVCGDGWHKGVLGIVAARLCEEFGRPVFVVGFDNGLGTGSARGQGQINLYNSLEHCSSWLVRYGGHRDAAGFSIEKKNRDAFHTQLDKYAASHWVAQNNDVLLCDATLNPSQLTSSLLEEIVRMGPFGFDNSEPVFNVIGLDVLSARVVGTHHLKLLLKTPTGTVSAFGPMMGEYASNIPRIINVAASLAADEWRGDDSIELKLAAPPVACSDKDLF
ncbi:MAG: single-stranded-DNA-specific exonuclease RecJ [Deltaproteobacteria bacterium]|nr:single-stranded-DNA-specific exonuclease RecJ [Deltaproteobacteria bacterium]MBN2672777.1 single-stranded-DNA-specific exonuclease RecJ [Deltaproteobacteria bacterium]